MTAVAGSGVCPRLWLRWRGCGWPGQWKWPLYESSLNSHRAFFKNKILLFKPDTPNKMPSLSHSPTFQPDWILSGSGSLTAQLFSLVQVSPGSPISLVMTQPVSTVSVGEHRLCVSPTLSLFPPATSSTQVHPGAALSSLFGTKGAVDFAVLQVSCSRHWVGGCSSLGPHTGLRDLTIPTQSPYRMFFNVLYNFGLQTSYKLGFHWLFTLFFRRLARCSTRA